MESPVLSSLQPLIVFSQFTGFTLFKINSKIWKAQFAWWNFVFATKLVLFNCLAQFIFWTAIFKFDIHGTKIMESSLPKLVYFNMLSYNFTQIWFFVKRQRTVDMLKLLSDIDESFLDLQMKFDYRKERKTILNVLIFFLALSLILSLTNALCLKMYNVSVEFVMVVVEFYGFTCSINMISHEALGMIGIRRRFEKINSFLDQNLVTLNESSLRKLSKIHLMICDLTRAFNDIYGPIIVILVSSMFSWFCIFIFSVTTASFDFFMKYFFLACFQVVVNTFFFVTFAYTVTCAERVKTKGKSAKRFLYQLLHKKIDFNIRMVINDFIYQVDSSDAKISTGFFDLDYKFLFQVSCKMLYLIIL